jgi:hypothetical protein
LDNKEAFANDGSQNAQRHPQKNVTSQNEYQDDEGRVARRTFVSQAPNHRRAGKLRKNRHNW